MPGAPDCTEAARTRSADAATARKDGMAKWRRKTTQRGPAATRDGGRAPRRRCRGSICCRCCVCEHGSGLIGRCLVRLGGREDICRGDDEVRRARRPAGAKRRAPGLGAGTNRIGTEVLSARNLLQRHQFWTTPRSADYYFDSCETQPVPPPGRAWTRRCSALGTTTTHCHPHGMHLGRGIWPLLPALRVPSSFPLAPIAPPRPQTRTLASTRRCSRTPTAPRRT